MSAEDAACVVLASGLSARFGAADKLQANLCGKPVLRHVLEGVKSVGFGENFIVSQGQPPQNFTFVKNTNPESGQGHALRLGLTAAHKAGWDCIAVVLGDMPLITGSHLQAMLHKIEGNSTAVSVFRNQKMPPAVFQGEAISMILDSKSAAGARSIFSQLKPVTVSISAEEALDVDTPEDLARVAAIMKARKT